MKRGRQSNKVKKVYVPRVKKQTLGNRIVILLNSRNDVTRLMLPEILNKNQTLCDAALTQLRVKAGYRIWPAHGNGTPLRIATSQTLEEKYNAYRRSKFLGTAKRMIVAELETGERYQALADRPQQLLEILNSATNEVSNDTGR